MRREYAVVDNRRIFAYDRHTMLHPCVWSICPLRPDIMVTICHPGYFETGYVHGDVDRPILPDGYKLVAIRRVGSVSSNSRRRGDMVGTLPMYVIERKRGKDDMCAKAYTNTMVLRARI